MAKQSGGVNTCNSGIASRSGIEMNVCRIAISMVIRQDCGSGFGAVFSSSTYDVIADTARFEGSRGLEVVEL